MKQCTYAHKYKAHFIPSCNRGAGCDACNRIWNEEFMKRKLNWELDNTNKEIKDAE